MIRSVRRLPLLMLLVSVGVGSLCSARGQGSSAEHPSFAGKWKGKLHFESQDSYRGNSAKGQHRSDNAVWIFEISPDEKTVTYYPTDWKGPRQQAKFTHKNSRTITWHESEKQSAELTPKTFYDKQGRHIGSGVGVTSDLDADWTIQLLPDGTVLVHCSANSESIYARITDTTVTGTLKKVR